MILKEQLEKTLQESNISNITIQNYEEMKGDSSSREPDPVIADLTEENERLSSQVMSVREVVSEMEEELAGKSHDLDELRGRVEVLDDALVEKDRELLVMGQEMTAMKTESVSNLQERYDDLLIRCEEKEAALGEELTQVENDLREKKIKVEELLLEGEKRNEDIAKLYQQLQSTEEDRTRELELVRQESVQEMTSLTAEHKQKLTEKEEELNESEVSKTTQLIALQDKLSNNEKGLIQLKGSSTLEMERLTRELNYTRSEMKGLEDTRGREKVEREQLRGEMNRLTESSVTFSADSAKCRENILALEEELSTIQEERDQLSWRLESTLNNERVLKKELDDVKRSYQEMSSELDRYKSETGRMNNQFSSAVELLKQENDKLKVSYQLCHDVSLCSSLYAQCELSECSNEKKQLNKMSETLREQVSAEGDRSVTLMEKSKQLKTEMKTVKIK